MTTRPPPSSATRGPTPHHTSHRRHPSTSTTGAPTPRIPPHAPKPVRRPALASEPASNLSNPVFSLATLGQVPRASCGKADDILAPPDAQSCPFAKAGLKVVGMGSAAYGELEGWLEWPAEVYAEERGFSGGGG
jgi:hypothetical protein